ncbi:hypothetical protein ACSSS7_001091 [Eimeria intestinalis]
MVGLKGEVTTARATTISRRPLFLTQCLLSVSDAAALLQQGDTSILAQQLEEVLQLEAFSRELATATAAEADGSPATETEATATAAATITAATTPERYSSHGSKASTHEDTAEATSRLIETDARRSSNNSSNNSNNNSSNNSNNCTSINRDSSNRSDLVPSQREATEDFEHAAAAAAGAEPNTADRSPLNAEPQQEEQQQQKEDEKLQQQQQQHDEWLMEARHLIVLEYFLSAVSFCRTWKFSPLELSAFLALLLEVYRHSILQRLSAAAAFDLFKQQLLRHAVFRPPISIQVFSPLHLKPATDFFLSNFLALLPQLQLLHAGPPTLNSSNSSNSSSSSNCSSSPKAISLR